ncbi:YdgA family protein [Chitinilyticum piscinae]|uniref:YdgA family protein n=1 Tax=Chitinilyticum piscinae TaxID=2866724 RepID=A0A8J7KEZ0_9NEIS|nr:YdgA family protein [Chitinilyticum piscinae]MBE9609849.1 YdgA family protein [Chitinilyticum piscinae]
MNKVLVGGVAVALLAAGGYVGATWYVGQKIDGALDSNAAALGKYKIIKQEKRQFDKGLFSSVELVTYRIGCAEGLEGSPFAGTEGTLTLKNTISHNPFAPTVKTEIILDEKTRAELAKVFKGQEPLSIVTRVSLDGSYQTEISSPAFVHEDAQGKLDWKGISATVKSDQQLSFADFNLKMSGLSFSAGSGEALSLGEVTYTAATKKSAEGLYAGKGSMVLAGMELKGQNDGVPMVLKTGKLELSSDSSVEGGLMKGSAKGTLAGLSYNGKAIGDIGIDYELARIDAAAVKKINDNSIDNLLQCHYDPMKDMQVLQEAVMAILKKDPSYTQKIALKTPEGESSLNLKVASKGLTEADLHGIDSVLPKLDASVKLQVPSELVNRLIRDVRPAEEVEMTQAMVSEGLNQAAAQGFVVLDSKLIKSDFELKNGQMLLNGQPFDPSMLMGL